MPRLPQNKLYGIFRGVVENNIDEKEAGRCQIRVFGLHTDNKEVDLLDSVPTENLVWAQPCTPIFGGISGVGIYGVPCQGAHVFLFFENGNIMQPRYFATAPGLTTIPPNSKYGFSDPSEESPFPKEFGGTSDWNKGDPNSNYGDIFVIEDKCGNRIVFDSTEGNENIYIQSGGTTRPKLSLTSKGGMKKESANSTDVTQTGAVKTYVTGDSEYIVNGENIISSERTKISTLGDHNEYISGPADISITGIENKTSGGLSWNIKGDSSVMTGGKSSHVSDSTMKIQSNSDHVKLNATLMNIEMMALVGTVKSQSLLIDMLATTEAKFMGTILTTLGGGLTTEVKGTLTTISGDAMVQITGGLIMIG